jgi:hypothetical protein
MAGATWNRVKAEQALSALRDMTFKSSPPITPANIEHVEGEVRAWMIPGSGSITTDRKTATAWEKDFGCTVEALVRAKPPASGVRVKHDE